MSDQELRDALRSLPRHGASPGFTRRVLSRCERSRLPLSLLRSLRPAPVVAVVLALALAIAVPFVLPVADGPESAPAAAGSRFAEARPVGARAAEPRREQLRAERARLAAELEELKRLAASPDPVLYVGGDDRYELVLDVERMAAARADRSGRPLPAGVRTTGRNGER